MKLGLSRIVCFLTLGIAFPTVGLALPLHYRGEPMSVSVNYYSPKQQDYSQSWNLGDSGFITATWDPDTGEIELSALFTAPTADPSDPRNYPDFFFHPLTLHFSMFIPTSTIETWKDPLTGAFSFYERPVDTSVEGEGLQLNTNYIHGNFGGNADFSMMYFTGYIAGIPLGMPYVAEVGLSQMALVRVTNPEPMTASLVLLSIPLFRIAARRDRAARRRAREL